MRAKVLNCDELDPKTAYDILWFMRLPNGSKDVQIEIADGTKVKSIKVAYQNIIWLDLEDEWRI